MSLNVKDGMKVAAGAWLFYKLLGFIGGCLVLLFLVLLVKCPTSNYESTQSASLPRVVRGNWTTYPRGCNVRAEPRADAQKIGFVTGKQRIISRQGKWRKIALSDGAVGWAGCVP